MRGCVAAALTFLFLSTAPLGAQCNASLVYSGAFRASYLDLAIENNDLWVATSYGVQLFDRSVDPPAPVASIAVPGITRVVRAVGGVAYAGSGSSVYVIHRSGKTLSITGSYDAGANVNDLVITPAQYGFIATANGLRQVDFFNLNAPFVPMQTTGANVTSLATDTTLATLYAADGDNSVEIFNIVVPNAPQHTGTLTSLPRVTSVETTPTRLYASDGISTDVFINGTKAATVAKGTLTLATLNGDVLFAAGSDRHIRAADWTSAATPVELFGTDIVPTGGTINRVAAMRTAGNRLYVAAGDAGLLTFDLSSMASPFPIRSYVDTPMTSTLWVDGKLYASRSGGGIAEYVKSISTGYLTAARQWDARVHTIHDGTTGFLLTSSGTSLFYWTLGSTTPVLVTSATLRANVVSAIAINSTAYAVLSDNSVWSVDLAAVAPVPQLIANAKATRIAHAGTLIGTSYDPGDGTTAVTFYTKSDMSDPGTVTVSGSSTTPLTMAGNTAAIFTFSGINLIDATSRAVTTIPGSNSGIARRLVLGSSRIFELTSTSLLVWDLGTKKLTRTMALPTDATSLSIDTIAAMATATGVETAAFDSSQAPPALLGTRNNNTYYKKVAAGADRLYLFGPNGIDVFETRFGFTPHYLTSFSAAGILDVTANDSALYTVSSSVVTAYSREGGVLAQTTLDTSSQPLAIVAAGNAVWLAVSRGCTSGGCEKKTLVLDPRTLGTTATLDGGVVDAATNGNTVYAIFDLPAEVRQYDSMVLTKSVPAPGSTTPVSIALYNNNVYVAGDQLYSYDLQLAQRTDNPPAFQPDAVAGFAFKDQRVASIGTCLLVSRSAQPQWVVPAVIRSVAQTAGRLYLLTDDSLEIWATGAAQQQPSKRRGVSH